MTKIDQPPTVQEVNEQALQAFWSSFSKNFKTEEDSCQLLYQAFHAAGKIRCHHCGQRKIEHVRGSRVIRCVSCRKKSWFTAGTVFDKAKLIRPWHVAIALIGEGIIMNAASFARLVGLATSSAWELMQKVTRVVARLADDSFACASVQHFTETIYKRSRLSLAGEHPRAEIDAVLENEKLGFEEEDGKPELGNDEQLVYDRVTAVPVSFDKLCQLTNLDSADVVVALGMLRVDGLVEACGGDLYCRVGRQRRASDFLSPRALATVAGLLELGAKFFRGISLRHLESYVARQWCQLDRSSWTAERLLQECVRAEPASWSPPEESPASVFLWTPS